MAVQSIWKVLGDVMIANMEAEKQAEIKASEAFTTEELFEEASKLLREWTKCTFANIFLRYSPHTYIETIKRKKVEVPGAAWHVSGSYKTYICGMSHEIEMEGARLGYTPNHALWVFLEGLKKRISSEAKKESV